MSEAELPFNRPPLLNRILRCSACAKNLLYGILIFIAVTTTITLLVFQPPEISQGVIAFVLISGFTIAFYGFVVWGTSKLFKAYCDKDSEFYDDGLMIFLGMAGSFMLFVVTLAIVHDFVTQSTPFFVRGWENAFG